MKTVWSIFLLIFLMNCFLSAQSKLDSLESILELSKDTNRVKILESLATEYARLDPQKALSYARDGVILGTKIHFEKGRLGCMIQIATAFYTLEKYQVADSIIIDLIDQCTTAQLIKEKANALLLAGAIKERQGKFDEALPLLEKACEIAASFSFNEIYIRALINIANIYLRKADYQQAISIYQQAIELSLQGSPNQLLANAYRNIGITYKRKGDFELSLDYYYKALRINQELKNPRRLAENWNSIGTILSELNRPDKSQAAYKKALSFIDENQPSRLHYKILINIGQQYSTQNNLDSALHFYEKALSYAQNLEGFLSKGVLLYNIGSIHLGKEKYNLALTYFDRALKAEPDMPDLQNNVRVWIKMGLTFFYASNYSKSISYLEKALLHAKQLGLKKSKSQALQYLSDVYKEMGNSQKALAYYEEYILVKDSLFNDTKAAQIQDLVLAHEEAQNEQKIKTLEQEKTIQKLTQDRLWFGVLAIAIIGLSLFLYQRKRMQYAKQQQHILKIQKNWLELQALRNQFKPHFVFNALASIQNFLIQKDTDKAQLYLSEFAQLMREMLENSDKDEILLEDEIEFLNRYLVIEQLRTNQHFDFELMVEKGIDISTIFIPNLLLHTIVENAIWHGVMPRKEKGKIDLRFMKKTRTLVMEVEDNGVGRNNFKKKNHTSKGLSLLQQRIEALREKKNVAIQYMIEDLKNKEGKPSGTKVSIEYLLSSDEA